MSNHVLKPDALLGPTSDTAEVAADVVIDAVNQTLSGNDLVAASASDHQADEALSEDDLARANARSARAQANRELEQDLLDSVDEAAGEGPNAGMVGQRYWRSVAEYADSDALQQALADEFVDYDPEALKNMSRRRFMRLCAASMALAGVGLTGCRRWPKEYVVPFSTEPDGTTPGATQLYATVVEKQGVGTGLLATSVDGRPIKLDGNSLSYGSPRGSSDVYTQAATIELYDPDRPTVPTAGRQVKNASSWPEFGEYADSALVAQAQAGTLAVLAEPSSSQVLAEAKAAFLKKYPKVQWFTWEPLNHDHVLLATKAAFGQPMRPVVDLEGVDRVVSFGDAFLDEGSDHLNLGAGWAKGRQSCDQGRMSRLYMLEAGFTGTGSAADHRIAVANAKQGQLLEGLAAELGLSGRQKLSSDHPQAQLIADIAADLKANLGSSIVLVGGHHDPALIHLGYLINQQLGAMGKALRFVDDPIAKASGGKTQLEQIQALSAAISSKQVRGLVVLGGNPAYDAPADLKFADKLQSLDALVHHSLMVNETSLLADWHLPETHFLEAWGDALAYDGSVHVQQPLILPLFDSKSRIELISVLAGADEPDEGNLGYLKTFEYFRSTLTPNVKAWRQAVHDGVIAGTGWEPKTLSPRPLVAALPKGAPITGSNMELNLVASPVLFDGRHANNGWLQELPQPMTKLTWDNAALISYLDAKSLDVNSGDKISLTVNGVELIVPVMIVPGTALSTITLHLGYGRTTVGRVGGATSSEAVGVNAYNVRFSTNMDSPLAQVKKSRGKHKLAYTQEHHLLDGVMVNPGLMQKPVEAVNQYVLKKRAGKVNESGYVIKETTLSDYLANKDFVHANDHGDVHLQLFEAPKDFNSGRHAWGMTIDMSLCHGCNACVVACQAENNIPVVGKDQVLMSREMNWLRIDRYFKGDPKTDQVTAVHQPLACVHCENAPCEAVCPFAATVHDTEGLNTMVYNRCVGTRYCANNCPYKVRRYNYFDYHARQATAHGSNWKKPWLNLPDAEAKTVNKIKQMSYNPDVTVRMRGVMEKCSYCTQRIQAAKSVKRQQWGQQKKLDPTAVFNEMITDADGLQVACQQACSTNAIVFGNLKDPNSRVSQIQKNNARAYDLLGDFNTKPRTKYLARINNPNEAIAIPGAKKDKKAKDGDGKDGHGKGSHASDGHAPDSHAGDDHGAAEHH